MTTFASLWVWNVGLIFWPLSEPIHISIDHC
jgi:hypothetical protein